MKFSPLLIILCLASLLFTISGTAQQVETKAPDAAKPKSKAEPETNTTQAPVPEKPRAATRFTPTEKIHADDAVSFPIDI